MSNTVHYLFKSLSLPAGSKALAVVPEYALSVFLAMSLMRMQLWTLAELGGPLIIVLVMQVVMAVSFILFVVLRAIGRGTERLFRGICTWCDAHSNCQHVLGH